MMGMPWGYGMGFGMIIWWGLIIGLIVLAVYGLTGLFKPNHQSGRNNSTSALEILKERYAKGEISEEEYEQKKDILLK